MILKKIIKVCNTWHVCFFNREKNFSYFLWRVRKKKDLSESENPSKTIETKTKDT